MIFSYLTLGGQYKYGTTDITRTIGFGKNQIELKIFFHECFKRSHCCC